MAIASASSKSTRTTWTADQDELLAYWQSQVGNRWSVIAQHIPGKSGQQCAQRWRHRVNPAIRKEKWTPEEDSMLTHLVAQYGGAWAEISRHMPGRTDQQCMGRWKRHLDPGISRVGWTAQEDSLLAALVTQHGHAWSTISSFIPGRIAQQCRSRWKQLNAAQGLLTPRAQNSGQDASPAAAPQTRRDPSHAATAATQDDDEEISDLSDHDSDPGSVADAPSAKQALKRHTAHRFPGKSPGSTAYNSVMSTVDDVEEEGDIVHSHSATMTAGLRSHASLLTGSYDPDPAPKLPVAFSPIASPTRRLRSTRSALTKGQLADATPRAGPSPGEHRLPPARAVRYSNPAAASSVAPGVSVRSSQLCKHGSNDPGAEKLHELVRMSELLEKADVAEEGSITDGQPEDTSPVVVDTADLAQTPSARRLTSKYYNQSVPASWKVLTTTPKAQRARSLVAEPDTAQALKGRRQEQAASTEETVGDLDPCIATSPPFSHARWNALSPPAGTPTALLHPPSHHVDGVHELLTGMPDWGSARRMGHGFTTPPTTGSKVQRRLLASYEDELLHIASPIAHLIDSPAKRQRVTRRSIAESLAGAAAQTPCGPTPSKFARASSPMPEPATVPPSANKPPKESRLAGALALLGQMDEQGTAERQRRRAELRSEASANDRASLNLAAELPAQSAATESSQGNLGSALGTPGTKQQVASSAPKTVPRLRRELHSLLEAV